MGAARPARLQPSAAVYFAVMSAVMCSVLSVTWPAHDEAWSLASVTSAVTNCTALACALLLFWKACFHPGKEAQGNSLLGVGAVLCSMVSLGDGWAC
jgi:hypothetical protein